MENFLEKFWREEKEENSDHLLGGNERILIHDLTEHKAAKTRTYIGREKQKVFGGRHTLITLIIFVMNRKFTL